IWKWPRHWPYSVSIWFGPRISRPGDVQEVRQAVQDLGAEAVQQRKSRSMTPPRALLRACRRFRFRDKVVDSTGVKLTGGSLLLRSLILRRLLMRALPDTDERQIGILLPPSVGGVVTNAAVSLMGRVAVNLNYTITSPTMTSCLKLAGIRHVLTSRKVMEKLDLEIDAELIYLEDFREKVTLTDKVAAAIEAHVVPAWILDRMFSLHTLQGDDVLTVIFTSGSSGEPKGVTLTQHNISSNVEAVDQVVQLKDDDVMLGILPFFHSFGYTITLWTVLTLDIEGAYHFSPLDARQVGELCRRHRVTLMLSTPTFLRSYIKRCDPGDLETLDVVVTGAERLPKQVVTAFEEKFGLRPVEGYGTTELSPLVSLNVPPGRSSGSEIDCREGSVGRPVPGVTAKVVHPETFENLPVGASGMLLIKGPNVMKGYLGQPEKTAEVIRDGWYITGDIAKIDADGFIWITGRQSRFSKIGGEMVPHVRIEEELHKIVQEEDENGHETLSAVVMAVDDPRKGERLVVLHTDLPFGPDEIGKKLAEAGLPNLWIPAPDSFLHVDDIPMLGSGKIDLKEAKRLAEESLLARRRE
ncbi:MAG: AMP-binding protein, partial [Pirellulales bacterium]